MNVYFDNSARLMDYEQIVDTKGKYFTKPVKHGGNNNA